MNPTKLMKERATLHEQFKALLARVEDAHTRSDSDVAQLEEIDGKISKLTKLIEIEARAGMIGKSLDEVANKALHTRSESIGDENRDAFISYIRSGNPEYVRSINSFSSTEGGALLPTNLASQIVTAVAKSTAVRRIAGVQYLTTNSTTDIPVATGKPAATWGALAPSGSASETDIGFVPATLRAYKLHNVVKVAEEMLMDSPTNLESTLVSQMSEAFVEAEDAAYLVGNAANTPTGIFATSGIGEIALGTAVTTGSATHDKLIDAVYTLPSSLRGSATWVVGDFLGKTMRKARDNNGQLLWQPSALAGQPDVFMGLPVLFADALPTTNTGTLGGLVVGSALTVGDREGIRILRLSELYIANGFVGFRATKRSDIAVTRKNGIVKITST